MREREPLNAFRKDAALVFAIVRSLRPARVGVALALVVFLLATTRSHGYQSQVRPEFRASTELGHVDVIVLDDKRQPVRGLTVSDFTLTLNRVTTKIQAFAAVDLPSAPAGGPSPWVRTVSPDVQTNTGSDEGRLVVIYFDRSVAPGTNLATAKQIAAAAVQQLGTHDQAAVLGARGRPVQNFTGDRSLLLAAIDQAVATAPGQDEAEMANRVLDAGALSAFRANDACFCNTCVLRQIGQIADGLRQAPRPKVLLFIGSQLTMDSRDIEPASRLIAGGSTQVAQCSGPVRDARNAMIHALDRTNITVHTLDPSGLQVNAPTASTSYQTWEAQVQSDQARTLFQAYQGQIRVLPDRTGGRVVTNTNTPQLAVPALFAETGSYYVLGFEPPAGDAAIEVKVRGRNRTVHFQLRYDPAPAPSPDAAPGSVATQRTPTSPAAAAASELLPASGRQLSLGAIPFLREGSTSPEVFVVVGFPPTPADASRAQGTALDERVELFLGAFDRRSTLLRETLGAVEVRQSDLARGQEYTILGSLRPLGSGLHEIRVGAASGGRASSVVTYVDVPRFLEDPLSLSGIAVAPVASSGAATLEGADGALSFVPTTRRMFATTEVLRVFARVYEGGGGPLIPAKVEFRVADSNDVVKLYQSEIFEVDRFGTARASDLSTQVPLTGFAAGEYLLSVGALDGRHTVRRDIRFSVK